MKNIRKAISFVMSLCTLFLAVTCFIPIAKAAVSGTITGNEVRFRSAPSTAGEKLAVLNSGDIISVTNQTKLVVLAVLMVGIVLIIMVKVVMFVLLMFY